MGECWVPVNIYKPTENVCLNGILMVTFAVDNGQFASRGHFPIAVSATLPRSEKEVSTLRV